MPIANPDGFKNLELMQTVRNDYLNPLITKMERNISPRVDQLEADVNISFKDAELVTGTTTLKFTPKTGAAKEVDLSPIIPVIPPIPVPTFTVVESVSNIVYPKIDEIRFDKNLLVSATYDKPDGRGYATVTHPGPWAKVGINSLAPVTAFSVIDPNGKSNVLGETLNIVIPEDKTKISTKVGSGEYASVEKIAIKGTLGTTSIADGVLTLDLPAGGGGGGGTVTNQNFKGFYSNLGDLESQVQDPMNDMSYAFAKDSEFAGSVYTPYFYVNNKWEELNTDPAITYEGTTGTKKGVFSIKPDPKITIDSKGQLDLSKLGEDNGYFHGFFDTVEALTAAVTHPALDRSFAYTKHYGDSWVGRKWSTNVTSGAKEWKLMAPIGGITLVTTNSSGGKVAAPIYGIHKNELIDVDTSGLITIKGLTEPELKVEIVSADGSTTQSGSFKTVQYMKGKSNVTLDDSTKKLTIQHPQQVITYDSSFESANNSQEFRGNIYYDQTSRCWMGWGTPEASGGVDVKWTRIAHPKMSDEVKDLSRRTPRKAPYVTPGVVGDAPLWEYNSWTYVRKDDSNLPTEFRERCGAYFMTVIQDVENDTTRPQERYQICYSDEDGQAISYVRRWKRTATVGEYGWQDWVKISMSEKDISAHNTDPSAHRGSFKFYKVGTLDMSWVALKNKNWKLADSDFLLLADSDGISKDGEASIKTPYTGSYRFSGRLDFDGWGTTKPYQKPTLILYVYKTKGSQSTIISEHSYEHKDTQSPPPPLQWKSGEIQLEAGDQIHFEIKAFGGNIDTSYPDLRFIPNRNFFVMEDFKTTAGSRIAETFRRTMGSLNAHYNVGVNVHYTSGASGPVRVYGSAVTAQATNMAKIKG